MKQPLEWTPAEGSLLPTCREAVNALLDYAAIFLRIQVEWLAYLGMVKDDDEDDSGASSPDAPPSR